MEEFNISEFFLEGAFSNALRTSILNSSDIFNYERNTF